MTVFFAILNDDMNAFTELLNSDPSIISARNDRVLHLFLV